MKKKIFKYNFVYYLAIIYSILIFGIYLYINITKEYFENVSLKLSIINLITNNLVFIPFLLSIIFLVKKSFKSFLFLNVGLITFSLVLLMGISNRNSNNGSSDYYSFDLTALIINLSILIIVNFFKSKKLQSDEIDKIGEKEIL